MPQDLQHWLHLGEDLHLVASMQEYLEAFIGQVLCVFLAVADFFQGMEQYPPAQGTDAVFQAGLGLHQAFADGEQVFHRHPAQEGRWLRASRAARLPHWQSLARCPTGCRRGRR